MKSSKSLSGKLAGAGALALGLAVFAMPAVAAPTRGTSVEIGFSGAGAIASDIRRQMPAAIAAERAANPGAVPAGARIVVRITTVFLSSDLGYAGGRRNGGSAMDDGFDGEVLLVDSRGHVLARKSVQSRSPVSAGGSFRNADHEQKRVKELVDRFAYWAVRALNSGL